MTRKKKALIWAIVAVIILTGAGVIIKMDHDNNVKAALAEKEQQLRIDFANQNRALRLYIQGQYSPLEPFEGTEDGIYFEFYFDVACYRKLTGSQLTYDEIVAYLSQEFEDDGEVRIYTNGRHPEIKEYIEWTLEHEQERREYIGTISLIYSNYRASYGITFLVDANVKYRNRAILDELIKKEADPDYVMDERIMWEGLPYGPYAG